MPFLPLLTISRTLRSIKTVTSLCWSRNPGDRNRPDLVGPESGQRNPCHETKIEHFPTTLISIEDIRGNSSMKRNC